MPAMSFAGVTSNAGFRADAPFGASRTLPCVPLSSRPLAYSTSSSPRSSMGIAPPSGHPKSIVLSGAAT